MKRTSPRRTTPIPRRRLDALRKKLLERQRELFDDVEGLEGDLRAIEESREAEIEMRSQQEAMDRLLDGIRERDRHELEEIHRALVKMATGSYGTCESCGEPIAAGRLEAIPETRTCIECAQEAAGPPPHPFEPRAHRSIPAEYRDLDDDELAQAVRSRIEAYEHPDLLNVDVRAHGTVVRLSGTIPGERQRQVLFQIIADGMGLEVIDRLRVAGVDREPPGEEEPRDETVTPPEEERIPAGRGMRPLRPEPHTVPEDEGEPPETPPDEPVPEKE